MYRAFELIIDDDISEHDWFSEDIELGRNKASSDFAKLDRLLRDVIVNGTIDGTKLTEEYFPVLRRDVFLSYSHNDQDLAYSIAGMLNSYFGLSVFIDFLFWGSADSLLREIDNKFCLKSDGETYSYEKRNFSTSHVHTMLTSAIMKAMDQAEIIIFLNTPESAPNLKKAIDNNGYDEYTLSPWIYEEILLTTMLKETDWEVYRRNRLDEGIALEHFEKRLQIKYKLPKEKLIPLTLEDIYDWYDKYEKRKKSGTGRYGGSLLKSYQHQKHPLNVLYELKCGVEERSEPFYG